MSLFNPKQMYIRFDKSPHFVRVTFDEEVYRPRLAGVFFHFEQKGLGIHGSGKSISKWAQVEFAFSIHKVKCLGSAKQVIGGSDGWSIRRQEFGEQGNENKDCEKRCTYQGQSV